VWFLVVFGVAFVAVLSFLSLPLPLHSTHTHEWHDQEFPQLVVTRAYETCESSAVAKTLTHTLTKHEARGNEKVLT
jgi:hypothetical protein